MKTLKLTPALSILLILLFTIKTANSQNMTADTVLANKYFETAEEYFKTKSYDTAIVYFEKASILYQKHEQWRKYLQSETKHGECYQKQLQLDQAIATIKPAINISLLHINENDTIVADAYHTLGLQYYYQSKSDSALFYWEKALKIRKKLLGEKHISVASSYNGIGIVHHNKNEYDLALEYYFKSIQIRKELLGEKHNLVANTYNNIGIAHATKNEFDLALECFFKSLQIYKEMHGEIHTLVATSYNNIGQFYSEKNEYDLALEYFFKSVKIYKELFGEKHTDLADSYNNIGVGYRIKNEDYLALEYFFKSLLIYKELLGENHTLVAKSYSNIGFVYTDKNEYDLALQYHFKSLQIYKELLGENHTDVARCYNGIGIVYWHIKEYDLALEYFFKFAQIYKELLGENHTYVADSYNNIGVIYTDMNEYDLALEYFFKSLEIRKNILGNKNIFVAKYYINIGVVYSNKTEYELALQYYQKGIAASLRNFNDTANIYSVPLIDDYLNWDELLGALHTKAEIFADSNINLQGFGNFEGLKIALRHHQACDTLISKVRQEITTKSDKLALGEIASEVYERAIDVCINLSGYSSPDSVSYYNELAFYFSEKNKSSVLLESLAGIEAQKFAGIPETLLAREHKLSIDIVSCKQILAEGPDSLTEINFQDKLFKANRSYDSLILVFENNYPKYYELKYNQKPATVAEIQTQLGSKTAMISYFVGDSIITIFTLTAKKLDVATTPIEINFDTVISDFCYYGLAYRNNLFRFAKSYKRTAYNLYQKLIPKNLDDEIKNLIIIPDADLGMIPFEALLTEKPANRDWKDLPYLIRKYNISYSYSANLFHKTFTEKPAKEDELTNLNDWLALAPVFDNAQTAGTTLNTRRMFEELYASVPDTIRSRGILINGGSIRELPGTEIEVNAIFNEFDKKELRATVKTHSQASEEFVKSGELQNYKYVHFATHGFVNALEPELSGILLAQDTLSAEDCILHTGEMYNLELNSELVVLSACETGLGKITKGEGVIGLSRALLYAGTKNLITSLWEVPDLSTSELMIGFYKNMLGDNQQNNISKYLRQTKLKMINEGTYSHPYYWSPFILIGR